MNWLGKNLFDIYQPELLNIYPTDIVNQFSYHS